MSKNTQNNNDSSDDDNDYIAHYTFNRFNYQKSNEYLIPGKKLNKHKIPDNDDDKIKTFKGERTPSCNNSNTSIIEHYEYKLIYIVVIKNNDKTKPFNTIIIYDNPGRSAKATNEMLDEMSDKGIIDQKTKEIAELKVINQNKKMRQIKNTMSVKGADYSKPNRYKVNEAVGNVLEKGTLTDDDILFSFTIQKKADESKKIVKKINPKKESEVMNKMKALLAVFKGNKCKLEESEDIVFNKINTVFSKTNDTLLIDNVIIFKKLYNKIINNEQDKTMFLKNTETFIKKYLKEDIFMNDDWFSKANIERDIVVPNFIEFNLQSFNAEYGCLRNMFVNIFKKFKFCVHPVKYEIDMSIDNEKKRIADFFKNDSKSYSEYLKKVNDVKAEDFQKEIHPQSVGENSIYSNICKHTYRYKTRIVHKQIYTLKHHTNLLDDNNSIRKSTLLGEKELVDLKKEIKSIQEDYKTKSSELKDKEQRKSIRQPPDRNAQEKNTILHVTNQKTIFHHTDIRIYNPGKKRLKKHVDTFYRTRNMFVNKLGDDGAFGLLCIYIDDKWELGYVELPNADESKKTGREDGKWNWFIKVTYPAIKKMRELVEPNPFKYLNVSPPISKHKTIYIKTIDANEDKNKYSTDRTIKSDEWAKKGKKCKIRFLNYDSQHSAISTSKNMLEKKVYWRHILDDVKYITEYVTTFYKKQYLKDNNILLKTRIKDDNLSTEIKTLKKAINKYYDNFKYIDDSETLSWKKKTNEYMSKKMKDKDKKLLEAVQSIAKNIPLNKKLIEQNIKMIKNIRVYEKFISIKEEIDEYREQHDEMINECNTNFNLPKEGKGYTNLTKMNDTVIIENPITLFYIGSPYYMNQQTKQKENIENINKFIEKFHLKKTDDDDAYLYKNITELNSMIAMTNSPTPKDWTYYNKLVNGKNGVNGLNDLKNAYYAIFGFDNQHVANLPEVNKKIKDETKDTNKISFINVMNEKDWVVVHRLNKGDKKNKNSLLENLATKLKKNVPEIDYWKIDYKGACQNIHNLKVNYYISKLEKLREDDITMEQYEKYCAHNANIFEVFYDGEKMNKISKPLYDKVFHLGFLNGLKKTWKNKVSGGNNETDKHLWGLYSGWTNINLEEAEKKRQNIEKETEFIIFCKNCYQGLKDIYRGNWMIEAYNKTFKTKFDATGKMPTDLIEILKNAFQLMLIVKHGPDYKNNIMKAKEKEIYKYDYRYIQSEMMFIKYLVLTYKDDLKNAYRKLNEMYTKSLTKEQKYYGFQFQRWLSGGTRLNTERHANKRQEELLKQIQLWWYLCLKFLYDKGYNEHLQLLFLINDSTGIIENYENIKLKNMGLSESKQSFMSGKIAAAMDGGNGHGNMGFMFSTTPECIGYRFWTFADYGVRQMGIPWKTRKEVMAQNFINHGTYQSSIHFFINRLLTVFPLNGNKLRSFIIKYGFRNKKTGDGNTNFQAEGQQAINGSDQGEGNIKEWMNNLQKDKESDMYKFKTFSNVNLFNDKDMQLMYILNPHTNNDTKKGGIFECDSLSSLSCSRDQQIQEREDYINKLMEKKAKDKKAKRLKLEQEEEEKWDEDDINELEQLRAKQTEEAKAVGFSGRMDRIAKEDVDRICQEMNKIHNDDEEKKDESKKKKKEDFLNAKDTFTIEKISIFVNNHKNKFSPDQIVKLFQDTYDSVYSKKKGGVGNTGKLIAYGLDESEILKDQKEKVSYVERKTILNKIILKAKVGENDLFPDIRPDAKAIIPGDIKNVEQLYVYTILTRHYSDKKNWNNLMNKVKETSTEEGKEISTEAPPKPQKRKVKVEEEKIIKEKDNESKD
tara:strand:+ start:387 stop:5819 length:5433 start_codon:yes stop_codon:yes gene_type:complete